MAERAVTRAHREQAFRVMGVVGEIPSHEYNGKFLDTGADPSLIYPITRRVAQALADAQSEYLPTLQAIAAALYGREPSESLVFDSERLARDVAALKSRNSFLEECIVQDRKERLVAREDVLVRVAGGGRIVDVEAIRERDNATRLALLAEIRDICRINGWSAGTAVACVSAKYTQPVEPGQESK